jgi:hypothetical protein
LQALGAFDDPWIPYIVIAGNTSRSQGEDLTSAVARRPDWDTGSTRGVGRD